MSRTFLGVIGCVLLVSLPASAALRGVKLYEQGEYARARKVLEQELRSKKLSTQERSKARLYLAAALYAVGAEESARIQLEELALTDPSLTVDPVIFPRGFVTLAEQSRERVAEKARQDPSSPPVAAPTSPPGATAAKAEEFKRRLTAAIRLYESLEYEIALQQLGRAKELARSADQDVIISLYEGLILADMGQGEQSLAAFKTALLLDPAAQLPVKASPKVAKDFEDMRIRVREELALNERKQAEAQASAQVATPPAPEKPTSPAAPETPPHVEETPPARAVRLSPQVFGFADPLGKAVGAGGGLTLGLGSVELGARVLLGDALGVGAEAGLLLGSGMLQPRVGLRGTAIPSLSSYGGGAVVGLRLRPASRLIFLVDVGAEYFSAQKGYRPLTLTSSAGIGFDLL